ncbi:hypothetical protein [uncultured Methanobrevibacter sp.]|uniref:hypothetical protein n=1 Tax=uncultured Methanobrevibacter sp. TaxID=253161 RepID=UPI00260532B9|nr:hypothetical protein [uncultured Methanobrevibacter sp.]
METKDLIIITIAILIGCSIIGGAIYSLNDKTTYNQTNKTINITNNATTNTPTIENTVSAGNTNNNYENDVSSQETKDPGAFYSDQAGRTIYTGEIETGDDDHQWKHLGNNEWEKID